MLNMFKLSLLCDWFDDHDYHATNPDGTMSDRWKGRGPTSIYDDAHPIDDSRPTYPYLPPESCIRF